MDIFKQRWHEIKDKVRQKWNKLTNEDINQINGKREQLLNKLHSKYGWEQRHAEEELKRFENSLEGERGQKIRPEYNREEEDSTESPKRQKNRSESNREESTEEGWGKKTQKYNKEYFERPEEEKEEGSGEDQDFPKRKIR